LQPVERALVRGDRWIHLVDKVRGRKEEEASGKRGGKVQEVSLVLGTQATKNQEKVGKGGARNE